MKTRAKVIVGLTAILAAVVVLAVQGAAGLSRRLPTRARLALIENRHADLNLEHETLEAQVHALAARVAELQARLDQCCPPPPPPACRPCQEQGLCEGQTTCGQDADHDGVDDCADHCPCEPGEGADGCPAPLCDVCRNCDLVPCGHDADADGVDDCGDECPCRPGPADHHGCPVGEPCERDADCSDANGCSLDACHEGMCVHECLCVGPGGFDCCPGPAAECGPPR